MAVGRSRGPIASVGWLPLRPLPQFVSAGADGLLVWTLKADCLEMAAVALTLAEHQVGVECVPLFLMLL